MIWALPLLWVLNLADYLLTVHALKNGAVEINPLMAFILGGGTLAALSVKVVLFTAAVILLWYVRHIRIARIGVYLVVGWYIMIVCYEMVML
jgi:hypothetical protein